MITYLGKSCSFGLPFVNCRQFMYLVISLLALRAGCGIWMFQTWSLLIFLLRLCMAIGFAAISCHNAISREKVLIFVKQIPQSQNSCLLFQGTNFQCDFAACEFSAMLQTGKRCKTSLENLTDAVLSHMQKFVFSKFFQSFWKSSKSSTCYM